MKKFQLKKLIFHVKKELYLVSSIVSLICLIYFVAFFAYLNFYFDEFSDEDLLVHQPNDLSFTDRIFDLNNSSVDSADCYIESDVCFNAHKCNSREGLKVFVYSTFRPVNKFR